jgi:hypothetical protein
MVAFRNRHHVLDHSWNIGAFFSTGVGCLEHKSSSTYHYHNLRYVSICLSTILTTAHHTDNVSPISHKIVDTMLYVWEHILCCGLTGTFCLCQRTCLWLENLYFVGKRKPFLVFHDCLIPICYLTNKKHHFCADLGQCIVLQFSCCLTCWVKHCFPFHRFRSP